jgi:hypothetical protein
MSKLRFVVIAAAPLLLSGLALAEPPAAPDQGHGPWHKNFCTERYAHEASALAYLEAKLEITDKQRPAWTKWSQWKLDSAAKERTACQEDAPKQDAVPTAIEREAHHEKALALELQGLQSARPALQALYDTLTPDQRQIFDHLPQEHGPRGGMGR